MQELSAFRWFREHIGKVRADYHEGWGGFLVIL